MRRLWLIFAQAVTVSLAILFVVSALRPDWVALGGRGAPAVPEAEPRAAAPEPAPPAPLLSFANAVARAAPAVVNVYTAKHVDVPSIPQPNDPVLRGLMGQLPNASRRHESTSLGSGVIVRAGYVLTNYHVVEAADAIEVALADGRETAAQVVGADPDTDLAVLKLPAQFGETPVATLGADTGLKVGDVVLAIGNPFGVGQTTTQGIISALGRNRLGLNSYENFIQTDAAINPGNSGGALIDAAGNVVGINTAIYSQSGGSLGIGFAVPIDTARAVMDEIIRTGQVKRGWLGVEPQDLTPELARAFRLSSNSGVIIAGVMRDGPAGRGGLKVGDIVRSLDGNEVQNTTSMLAMIALLPPNQEVVVTVLRNNRLMNLKVKIGVRPQRPK
ncbi:MULTISPECIES: S1C family serine protease [unclassified Achromobacter]|uniref:S1C family serine protease n=1 Tax=unclassified Achromobacter TaxID=2626865 RepID=UPI000B519615|nr:MULTISPECIES: trypsin-like peptidase domain-containing protein [unclassified Achromobacter]OWT74420.1 2-alkenal reductase [Achromobacter sp. HZ34]OWT78887.1 2-alkenal reductase [Achromobacter sp. HZ28]